MIKVVNTDSAVHIFEASLCSKCVNDFMESETFALFKAQDTADTHRPCGWCQRNPASGKYIIYRKTEK